MCCARRLQGHGYDSMDGQIKAINYFMKCNIKDFLKKYPNMIKTLDNRHLMYNETLEFIKQLEQEGKATVIAPSHPIKISRFEKDINKLKELYELGYQDAATQINKIKKLKD